MLTSENGRIIVTVNDGLEFDFRYRHAYVTSFLNEVINVCSSN